MFGKLLLQLELSHQRLLNLALRPSLKYFLNMQMHQLFYTVDHTGAGQYIWFHSSVWSSIYFEYCSNMEILR